MESSDTVLHGVDFSGSKESRRKTWIATWREGEPAFTVNDAGYSELAARIARSSNDGRRHAWLIDAPFALPRALLAEHGIAPSANAAVEWLRSFASPREWRRACRAVSRREPRRGVDVRFGTPLAPTNLRLFKQTWHCLVSLLAPLAALDDVAILPMATAIPGRLDRTRVWVGEGCPSSTLRQLGWPRSGYKGVSAANRELREELLRRVGALEGIAVSEQASLDAVADTEGDALDSLILLPAARRFSAADHAAILASDPDAALEGWVYV